MTKTEQRTKARRRALIGKRAKAIGQREITRQRQSENKRQWWRDRRAAQGLEEEPETDSAGSPDADLQELPDGVLA